jgi:hypothetical protein
MLRKMIVSSVAALGLAVPFVATSTASADPVLLHVHRHHYCVYYRCSCNAPWSYYGSYRRFCDAERVAHRLQRRGYEASIRS